MARRGENTERLGDSEVQRTQDYDAVMGRKGEDQAKDEGEQRSSMINEHNERLGKHIESGGFRGGMHIVDTMQARRNEDRQNVERERREREEVQKLGEAKANRRAHLQERFADVATVESDTERAELLARGY